MDRKNNHTANKNKQSKYVKLYLIEHSSEYLSIWIFYLNIYFLEVIAQKITTE